MKIVILGAPGAGKGTQASALSAHFSVPTISTGAIIRDVVDKKTALGLRAEKYILKGQLVPDDIIIDVIIGRLGCVDCVNGFVLDGFPRTEVQACSLYDNEITIDVALSIEVDDDVILKRLDGRTTCQSCGMIYHKEYRTPRIAGICDICGGRLVIRDDDKKTTIIDRLKVFHRLTEPLKEYYKRRGLLKVVYGKEEISDTTDAVFEVLGLERR